jgi:hypothetical protein
VGIAAGSREVPGEKPCDKRHPYRIIITIIIIIIIIMIIVEVRLKDYGVRK